MAEQYFQESMAGLKDAEGTRKAKILSIQDEYCHFLQVTGQEEVSDKGPQLTGYLRRRLLYSFAPHASSRHLLCARHVTGRLHRDMGKKAMWPLSGRSQILALGNMKI